VGPHIVKTLLIEDNAGDVFLIREMLEEVGGYALTAADLLAAGLLLLREHRFDVVLLDLGLPDSSGIESLRTIQNDHPELPVIVLTGLADEDLAGQAIGQGAQDYLIKGRIDGDLLTRAIRYAIERKKAQERSEFQLAQMNAVFNQMTEGLAIFDRNGELLDMNRSALEMHGFSDFAAVPRHRQELAELFEVADLAGNPLPLERWPLGRTPKDETIRNCEIRLRRRDTGRTLIVSYDGAPVRDPAGRLLLNLLTMRDVTDSKRSEEELQKVQRLESLGLLAGGIAHDFNNILTAILGNITLAKMFLPPEERSTARLKVAEQAALRARGLSQQLLTFATGGAPIKETVSVPYLVHEAMDLALRGSRVKYTSFFPADLQAVEADANQLLQALNNMAINAVQAMPEGGILEISASNECLPQNNSLGLPPGKFVCIRIKDQGIGIPKRDQEKIFDPYFTTKENGSGLGLSISFSIVKKHGGTITIDSFPGKGSTFSLFLPASPGALPVAATRETRETHPGIGRILVMDDDEVLSEIAAEMLQHLGYRVKTVSDGAGAVAAYRQGLAEGDPFAAVIVDLTIPAGMGGKEAGQHLLEMDPLARVIVSSGYASDPIMSDYDKYGFKGAIPKPYNLFELSKALREVLSGNKNT
jgi:PAS domain S-box-containing protein